MSDPVKDVVDWIDANPIRGTVDVIDAGLRSLMGVKDPPPPPPEKTES